MSNIAIKAEGLSKQYRIGKKQERYKALRDVMTDAALAPFRRVGKLLQGQATGAADMDQTIWALRDASFEIKYGEVVGVIGRNGAGKSTLLKILARITEPTTGFAEIHGRVGSLLEVGTGFHNELTGRENTYLNGAILGMKKYDIDRKFDEIVDFAELEKFIDTPVKHYSSGMYLRLAFAVAAHMDPEILLVDEVLAVGDASFQKKCLSKIDEVARGGRTVLLVSHNMSAITRLCHKAIRFDGGILIDQGGSQQVVNNYLARNQGSTSNCTLSADPSKPMRLREITVLNHCGKPSSQVEMTKPFRVRVVYDVNCTVTSAHVICFFHTSDGTMVFGSGDADTSPERLNVRKPGMYKAEFEVPAFLLGDGQYYIAVSLSVPFQIIYDRHEPVLSFSVVDNNSIRGTWMHTRRPGILGIELPWEYQYWGSELPSKGNI